MFSIKGLLMAWDQFFFEEKPTEGIALFRIIWISLLLFNYILDFGNLQDFYGPHAVISIQTVREQFPYTHANLFHLFQPTEFMVLGIYFLYGIALMFSLFGILTRKSLIIVLLCMTSFHQRNIWLLSSSELLMRSITIFLICSPCGHSLSIDQWLGRFYGQPKLKTMWPVWSLRLIQIQISVVYLWTVWQKLKGDTWIEGTAVYYATRIESMSNFTIPYVLDSLIFLKLATWGTLLVEIALGTLIWFKEFRNWVLLAGILFHLGIEYTMSIPFFEIIMLVLLITFITPEELKLFIDRRIAMVRELLTSLRRPYETSH